MIQPFQAKTEKVTEKYGVAMPKLTKKQKAWNQRAKEVNGRLIQKYAKQSSNS